MTDVLLDGIKVPPQLLSCHGTNCNNREHLAMISELYDRIITYLVNSNEVIIPKKRLAPAPWWTTYILGRAI